MRTTTRLLALAGLMALLAPTGFVRATEKTGKETGQTCVACHDKPGSKLLTDQGKYFEVMRTLDGYTEVKASFGKCTSCHARKPGSKKLTSKGKQIATLASDMESLRQWIRENHPVPAH